MSRAGPMRTWLVTVGEPLPVDPGSPRLLRAGLVAELAARRGHDVVWWTSAFDHHAKRMREGARSQRIAPAGYRLEMLEGEAYASNVSLARLRNHAQGARDFLRRAAGAPRPDVILCSYPTIELSEAAVRYGAEHGVPVVLDMRDLWPDIFLNLAPGPLRPLARLALAPMYAASRRACTGAAAITGITEGFVDWGLQRARRARGPLDRAFPLAYRAQLPAAEALERARRAWDASGVTPDTPTLCFFGTLGRQFDIPTVLGAARRLAGRDVRLVLCGAGDRLDEYRRQAADLSNVVFPGWVDAAAIRALMERSVAGLAPYYCEHSFTLSVPNKAVEYLSGGLPVLSTLSGELAALLERERCGRTTPQGDAQALAHAIGALLDAPGTAREMGDNARRAYHANFVAEVVYGRLLDHLAEVANR